MRLSMIFDRDGSGEYLDIAAFSVEIDKISHRLAIAMRANSPKKIRIE